MSVTAYEKTVEKTTYKAEAGSRFIIKKGNVVAEKSVPFSLDQIRELREEHPTPFHVYDEAGIRQSARRFNRAFGRVTGDYSNFFAVKALPNPRVLSLLKEEKMGADCSSLPELLLAEAAGLKQKEIIFTSNDTPAEEFVKAGDMGAIINLDDISHIDFVRENVGLPELICLRYNPGPLMGGNDIIGKPLEAKYGFTREQLISGYRKLKEAGVKRFGLHTMVVSNELDPEYFLLSARVIFDAAVEIAEKTGVKIEFINFGGGIGIPYTPEAKAVDLEYIAEGIRKLYQEKIEPTGLAPLRVNTECGRAITGPHGYLVTCAIHKKHTYKTYIGVDACMANLMRPGMYGAYHHVTVLGKEKRPMTMVCDITGSLCENNDKFAIDRNVPEIEPGDILVFHDTGAHGHAMGFNYNGKLRSAEFLMNQKGEMELIRRAETIKDYFATLDFPGL